MLVFVIVLSIVAAILFLVTLAFLIVFIVQAIRKDEVKKKRMFKVFLALAIVWILIAALDVTLVVVNRAKLFDTVIKSTAEMTANGLGTTAASLGKYYDENVIKRFENLDIQVSSYKVEKNDEEKTYTIDLVFNNQSPSNEKLYLHILMENNYLVGCDSDDFVYPIYFEDCYGDTDIIPKGKSRHVAEVIVPKDTDIKYLWYLEKELALEK